MGLSEGFIRRPVTTTLVTAAIVVFGIFGFRLLSVSALPKVEFPTISITATLPGASAETMAASVAGIIERQMTTIPGISSMNSSSALGASNITVQFDLDRNIDAAALDVQTALTIAQRRLPPEMTIPPSFRKVNPSEAPILFIALRSATLPLSAVNEVGDIKMGQVISQIPGVAQVNIFGSQKYAVRVQADPEAAAARGLTMDDIRLAIVRANSTTPVGALQGPDQNIALQASGAVAKADDFKPIVVAWRNGNPIKLDEVANVYDSVENENSASWFKDERSIILAIQKQSDANTVAVVDAIRSKLPDMIAQIPPAITAEVMMDRSISIREAVHDVEETLAIALGLVIVVIFLFLRSAAATFIPALSVPISLLGTCAAMYLLGFSINNMTLLALTLSVGFVVDDAIVMLENIMRHVEHGMRPFEAAIKGAREIGFTILAITFSLIAVFIPVLLMGGIVGRIFREFAVTVAIAIFMSAFVSLTLTPMLCARMLKTHDPNHRQALVLRIFEAAFDKFHGGYAWMLDKVLSAKPLVLAITIACLGGTVAAYIYVPKDFMPQEDLGFLQGNADAATDTSFAAMSERQLALNKIFSADPAVEYYNTTVGNAGPTNLGNRSQIFIALKPKKERPPARVVIERLQQKANAIPGVRLFLRSQQSLNVGGRQSALPNQYVLQSSDSKELYRLAPEVEKKLAEIPSIARVASDLAITNPQMTVDIDLEKAMVYGITPDQIRGQLYNAYGARQISTIYASSNDYRIVLEVMPKFRIDPTDLSKLYLKTAQGQIVPLDVVARMVPTVGPLQINHAGQQSSVMLSFSIAPGYSLSHATDAIRELERGGMLPISVTGSFSGTTQVFEDSQKGQIVLVLAAIFVAFIVLGILYESFIHPITIISGLPTAGIGAILTLMAFKMDLTVIALIGIVMLVGIVMKNAIMMVDFAIERRRLGLGAEQAIREAALLRFRPIMMTTFSAIFGTLPIALAAGAGAELRQPLGIAVVGGLCVSQMLTLFITPVVYIYLDSIDRKLQRRLQPQVEAVDEEDERRPQIIAAE